MNRPVRLCVLVSTLNVGGAEQLLKDLLLGLDPDQVQPTLLCFKDPGPVGEELRRQGVPIRTGLMPGRFTPWAVPRLARVLRAEQADLLLLINHRNALLLGVAAALLAGVPVVNWHNETARRYGFHGLTMALRRLAHRWVEVVVAAAKGHRDYILRDEGLRPGEVEVIYNGVSPQRAGFSGTSAEARSRFGLAPEARVVAQVAALRPDKAHEVMLAALVLVRQQLPQAVLCIAGDGPQRAFLEQRARELGLGEGCRFLGVVREVGALLAASDLMALSSRPEQETLSVAAIEAMFAGRPVVSTDVGFMREIVLPGETGLLVPPDDPAALAAALLELLGDPQRCARMGAVAAERMAGQCHAGLMVDRFTALFRRLAGEYSPAERADPELCLLITWREAGHWYLLQRLRQSGLRVRVLRPWWQGGHARPWLRRLGLRLAPLSLPLQALLVGRKARVWAAWSTPVGVGAGLCKRLLGSVCSLPRLMVRDFHMDPAWERRRPLRYALLRLALPVLDRVLTTSRREAELYAAQFGIARERLRFFPDAPPSQLLAEAQLPRDGGLFAYGNSDRDFATLVRAAGELPLPVTILSQKWRPEGALPPNVTLVRDYVSRARLNAYVLRARCCVLPLRDYAVAAGQNAMLEIMTLGCPLVVTRNTATEEYAEHGRKAWFFEVGDAEGLAAAVREVLAAPDRAAQVAARAKAAATALLDRQVAEFLELLREEERRG